MKSCWCLPSRSKEKKNLQRTTSFHSAVSRASTDQETVYVARNRIPTQIDIRRHPGDEWWSDARLDAPHVREDLGPDPRLLTRTLKVKVLNRDEKSYHELDSYFPRCERVLKPSKKYIVLQLLLGTKMIVSLGEAIEANFESVFLLPESQLSQRLKLVVNPANVKIPWSITGPREAASIREFFGDQHCSIRRKKANEIEYVVVTVDVYSKFMIRSFLPKLAFQPGRISDYMLVDYEGRSIVAGFRLVCTHDFHALVH